MPATETGIVGVLMDRYGRTYAEVLAELAGPGDRLVHLAAALVRVSLSRRAAEEIRAASGGTS